MAAAAAQPLHNHHRHPPLHRQSQPLSPTAQQTSLPPRRTLHRQAQQPPRKILLFSRIASTARVTETTSSSHLPLPGVLRCVLALPVRSVLLLPTVGVVLGAGGAAALLRLSEFSITITRILISIILVVLRARGSVRGWLARLLSRAEWSVGHDLSMSRLFSGRFGLPNSSGIQSVNNRLLLFLADAAIRC